VPEIINYGVSVNPASAATWVNPTRAVGAPDGLYASVSNSSTGWLQLNTQAAGVGLDLLPDAAVIRRVFVGVRMSRAPTAVSGRVKTNVGDTFELSFGITTTLADYESELDASKFTVAMLKANPLLQIRASSTASTIYADAAWFRVVYDEPPALLAYGTTATGWTTPANAVGAPNAQVAYTSATSALAVTMAGFAALPADAVLTHVSLLVRGYHNVTGGTLSITLPEAVTPATVYGPLTLPTTAQGVVEVEVPLTEVTAERLKRDTWRASLVRGGTAGQAAVDAVWTVVAYALPGAVVRAKRWDGSAWVDSEMKYWNGTSWVTGTVKRWDGGAWV